MKRCKVLAVLMCVLLGVVAQCLTVSQVQQGRMVTMADDPNDPNSLPE